MGLLALIYDDSTARCHVCMAKVSRERRNSGAAAAIAPVLLQSLTGYIAAALQTATNRIRFDGQGKHTVVCTQTRGSSYIERERRRLLALEKAAREENTTMKAIEELPVRQRWLRPEQSDNRRKREQFCVHKRFRQVGPKES